MLRIHLPDGTVRQYSPPVSPRTIVADIGPGLAKAALAAEVDGQIVGLDTELPISGSLASVLGLKPGSADDVKLRILTRKNLEALGVMRHSCAHVMARAVMRLFEGVQLAFGPTISGGFYYDFDLPHKLTEDDFPAIEAEMKKIVALDEPFERIESPRAQAIEICRDIRQTLKVEHITQGLAQHELLSFYRQGEFLDLCRGPHVLSPRAIGAFKLLSVAGAYWKGDAQRQQLQRLYATAFFEQADLDAHLKLLEEAKRRDHRVLGKQLELFAIHPQVGSGLILWLPKGATVRQELEGFIKEELKRRGYLPVSRRADGSVQDW
ncbi:MAG: TGS domain-containing protein, partial [Pirellulales bacterium]